MGFCTWVICTILCDGMGFYTWFFCTVLRDEQIKSWLGLYGRILGLQSVLYCIFSRS